MHPTGEIPMKLSFLLAQRQALLQQARLAHLAHAYDRLDDFARRVARARLRGEVRLQAAVPESGNYAAALTALQGSQSVIEEHFTDTDILRLADAVTDVTGQLELDVTFPIEATASRFLAPLRQQLLQSGIELDEAEPAEGPVNQDQPESRG
jgi:hypothetical protein